MLVPCLSILTNWVKGFISSHLRLQAIMVSSRNLLPSEQFRKQTQGYAVTRVTFSAWNPGPQLLHSFKIGLLSVAQRCVPSVISTPVKLTVSINHRISCQRKAQTVWRRPGINLCYSNSLNKHCQWEAHSMIRKLFLTVGVTYMGNAEVKVEDKTKIQISQRSTCGMETVRKMTLQPELRKSV